MKTWQSNLPLRITMYYFLLILRMNPVGLVNHLFRSLDPRKTGPPTQMLGWEKSTYPISVMMDVPFGCPSIGADLQGFPRAAVWPPYLPDSHFPLSICSFSIGQSLTMLSQTFRTFWPLFWSSFNSHHDAAYWHPQKIYCFLSSLPPFTEKLSAFTTCSHCSIYLKHR